MTAGFSKVTSLVLVDTVTIDCLGEAVCEVEGYRLHHRKFVSLPDKPRYFQFRDWKITPDPFTDELTQFNLSVGCYGPSSYITKQYRVTVAEMETRIEEAKRVVTILDSFRKHIENDYDIPKDTRN